MVQPHWTNDGVYELYNMENARMWMRYSADELCSISEQGQEVRMAREHVLTAGGCRSARMKLLHGSGLKDTQRH